MYLKKLSKNINFNSKIVKAKITEVKENDILERTICQRAQIDFILKKSML